MIEQSIIPQGFSPSYECWKWLHSEHRRVLQLGRKAYDSGNYGSYFVLAKFEGMLWNALMECTDAQHKATDKLLAEGKTLLAELAAEPDYSGYTGIPF